ncbi:MAG: class I SAM-dependent methyltransferase [Frankiaceae bacterium]
MAVAGTLPLTGERTVPGLAHENYWFRRHEAAYLAVLPWIDGAVVVEAGCGEGYGAARLAGRAALVVSLEADPAVVGHVRRRYGAQVHPVRCDLQRLPIGDARVEAVTCMQVIEHLHDQAGFVAECARALRPGGTLVMSTPNRLTFSPGRAEPLNPFHTRELDAGELAALLAPRFEVRRLLGVHHRWRLRALDRSTPGGLIGGQLAAAPERWPRRLAAAVARVRAGDFAVRADRVDESLDLLAIAVRRP